jgi:hypothetical protein
MCGSQQGSEARRTWKDNRVFLIEIGQVLMMMFNMPPSPRHSQVSRTVPVANTGMGLKLHYEVPLAQLHHFYRPPARLFLRCACVFV